MDANKPPRKSFRVIIDSTSAVSGNWQSGRYEVDIGDVLDNKAQWNVAVQMFFVFDASTKLAVTPTAPFAVISTSVPQGNTYTSQSNAMTQQLALLPAASSYLQPAYEYGSIGRRLMDVSFLRGNMMHVALTDMLGAPLTAAQFGFASGTPGWLMELLVWET